MQSLNQLVAAAQTDDRLRAASERRASGPPGIPGRERQRRLRPLAVLAARVARRLDAEAARGVLRV